MSPDPDLTEHLADVIAAAADEHGTFDHYGQAEAALAWLDEHHHLTTDPIVTHTVTGYLTVNWPDSGPTARITRDVLDEITTQLNDLNKLRLLLGHEPGDKPCHAAWGRGRLGELMRGTPSGPCLLPSRHVDESSWHAGLGGTWPL